MSLADVIRSAVAAADAVLAEAEVDITLAAWTGKDGSTKPTYATAVTLGAHVGASSDIFRTSRGEVVAVKAVIHILRPVAANGATDRDEPIDPRDKITLPSGTVGAPIMGVGGQVDPSTGRPYFYTVGLK